MKNSHLPFTISARRLAALHTVLDQWCCSLATRDEASLDKLYRLLLDAQETILSAYIESKPVASSRRVAASLITIFSEVTLDDICEAAKVPRRTAQTYMASFVDEGWVRRVKPGVYALRIP